MSRAEGGLPRVRIRIRIRSRAFGRPRSMDERLCFECTLCGECCKVRGVYAHVYVERAEVRSLAKHLGVTVREFRLRFTYKDHLGWTQLRFEEDRCVFLDPDTDHCSVHAERPVQCRTFPFWRDLVAGGDWTEEARALCEGVGRGPVHDKHVIEALMREQEEAEGG